MCTSFELLVVASYSVRQRYFAGIAKIGDVELHAAFKAALARERPARTDHIFG